MTEPIWAQELPGELKRHLLNVRDRIQNIIKSYGSFQKYGKTPFESIEELATLYFIAKEKASYRDIARYLGIQHVTVYRWIQAIEKKGRILVAGRQIPVKPEELIELAQEMVRPKARRWLKSVMDSAVIQEFISNPVKRHKSSKHGLFYTKKEIKRVLYVVNELAKFIERNQDEVRRITRQEPTNNPDLWTEEFIRRVIDMYCLARHKDSFAQMRCRRDIKLLLRRVQKWRDWFAGEIGTVRAVVRPKESTLFYEHYLRLKRMALESGDNELRAFWLIAGLHIESGSREGWGSLENMLERMEAQGVRLKHIRGLGDIDLDDELVTSSLIGIKWSKAKWSPDGRLLGFEIYEEKTKKYWNLSFPWLDEDIHRELERVYQETAKQKGIDSVVKSVLVHYGVKPPNGGRWTVEAFRKWYTKWVKQLKDMLGLPWDMNPHRLRSAHIAILAEFRIPMEMALSDSGFGVGWEDATTAMIFYLRFSRHLLQEYLRQAEEVKKRIAGEALAG